MKKTINIVVAILCILFAAWVGISWYDISADNGKPNPEHYSWNFFSVAFPVQTAANPPVGENRIVTGRGYSHYAIEDEAGNIWGWTNVEPNAFYVLQINDMGTPQIEDDIIVYVWEK